jgi:uncharacterized protein YeaO (DUF488 family)
MIALKRVYDSPSRGDGFRVLVDRLWPRGVKKEDAGLDLWLKEVAPSAELRKWYGHDAAKWDEFRKRYFEELKSHDKDIRGLLAEAEGGKLTLLYAAKDEERNNAVALKEYLEKRIGKGG